MAILIESPHPPCTCGEYGIGEKYLSPLTLGRGTISLDASDAEKGCFAWIDCPKHGHYEFGTFEEVNSKLPAWMQGQYKTHLRHGAPKSTARHDNDD